MFSIFSFSFTKTSFISWSYLWNTTNVFTLNFNKFLEFCIACDEHRNITELSCMIHVSVFVRTLNSLISYVARSLYFYVCPFYLSVLQSFNIQIFL